MILSGPYFFYNISFHECLDNDIVYNSLCFLSIRHTCGPYYPNQKYCQAFFVHPGSLMITKQFQLQWQNADW